MNPAEEKVITSASKLEVPHEEPPEMEGDDFLTAVYGESTDEIDSFIGSATRKSYSPWHHPVKQIVRDLQWSELAVKLLAEERSESRRDVLRYFTLPGADLLDVRVLADATRQFGTRIEYFGFDSGFDSGEDTDQERGAYFAAESALRQSGKITDQAFIATDYLEDIAVNGTVAADRLKHRGVFDIINIDACAHLAYVSEGRKSSIFNAVQKLLAHQLKADEPWLLFLTTRANVDRLGAPATVFQSAIHKNIEAHKDDFASPFADCIGASLATLATDMQGCWTTQNLQFLKLYLIGFGKYLLQFFHAQQNLPAKVELVSAFAYKVSGDEPDMLSFAFRVSPEGVRVNDGSAGGAQVIPKLELTHALKLIRRASRLWDLDQAIAADETLRREAVEATKRLLASANYDIDGWKEWLRTLPVRPMELSTL
ncbi:PP_RS20740 family protein [Agrobacterium tumefaciens]|uniref:PP_RS20740 family protein n=1 Tax=Agrobacterium tumefaciens TaxID=358 RepID=UPI0021CFF387|nr:hypothetical protein [Agrobacterium tumefaciens]UXT99767.1 hypothetical protein FY129_20095 [Agrobacterium tumefaciens]